MSTIYQAQGAIGATLTIAVDPRFWNFTAAVRYYSDVNLTVPVFPTSGSLAIAGHVPGNGGNSAFSDSPIAANASGDFASAISPLDSVVATPSSITGNSVAYYRVTITATEG